MGLQGLGSNKYAAGNYAKPVDPGPLPISTGDQFLFMGAMVTTAKGILDKTGYYDLLFSSPREQAFMNGYIKGLGYYALFGEALTTMGSAFVQFESYEKLKPELPRIAVAAALVGVKYYLLNEAQKHPLLKPVLLVLNAYGTYAVVRRAITQLNKCVELAKEPKMKDGSYRAIATNVLVHSVNSIYSIYRTAASTEGCYRAIFGVNNDQRINEIIAMEYEKNASIESKVAAELRQSSSWGGQNLEGQIRTRIKTTANKELACSIFPTACNLGNAAAQIKEVKKLFKGISLQVHPDKNPDRLDDATRAGQILASAKDLLSPKPMTVSDAVEGLMANKLSCWNLPSDLKNKVSEVADKALTDAEECYAGIQNQKNLGLLDAKDTEDMATIADMTTECDVARSYSENLSGATYAC